MARRLALLLAAFSLLLLGTPGAAQADPTWQWPLAGTPTVDRGFEPPASDWGAGHRGVDLEGRYGEVVLSAGAGRVTYAGLLAGRGVVTVTHADGLRTTYEPVDPTVSVGDLVDVGDPLGTLTSGHASCRQGTVCLHWGLLRGRTYLNPLSLVAPGHVRLLPLDSHGTSDKRKRSRRSRSRGESAERSAERSAGRTAERSVERGAAREAEKVAARGILRAAASNAARTALVAAPEVAVVAIAVGGTVWFLRRHHRRWW